MILIYSRGHSRGDQRDVIDRGGVVAGRTTVRRNYFYNPAQTVVLRHRYAPRGPSAIGSRRIAAGWIVRGARSAESVVGGNRVVRPVRIGCELRLADTPQGISHNCGNFV